ncbi:transcriptional repressor [Paracoccus sp. S-4012]|uniref:Fur family transcriptional regulator n=1 Tax=Paracoccus sp. S-4012 TaxID=2665648 RepID=UPI0012B12363|nr:Fur family transcriptional regulator [Paracoccus sp. S-4012]MRX52128.1 transcriptional repressor [Paracoccus sp. S-4012]
MIDTDLDHRIDELLRDAGLRVTRQRQAITRVLLTSEDHPDAEQVLARAREMDASVSQATTYRTLAALSERGLAHSHQFHSGASRFEAGDSHHHDHLIDVDSGEVIEFVSPEIERLQKEIAATHGYELLHHRHELYCRRIATKGGED